MSSSSSSSSSESLEFYPITIQYINLVSDLVALILLIILLAAAVVVYHGQNAHHLLLLIFRSSQTSHARKITIIQRKWLFILLHTALAFALFKVFIHEPVTLAQHGTLINAMTEFNEENPNDGSNYDGFFPSATIRVKQIRRICDYIALLFYFSLFCMVSPIWLQCAIVWLDKNQRSLAKKLRIFVHVTISTLLTLMILATIPLVGVSLYEVSRPWSEPSSDELRQTLIFYLTAPLGSLCLIFVLIFVAVFGFGIVRSLRESRYWKATLKNNNDNNNNNNSGSNNKTTIENNDDELEIKEEKDNDSDSEDEEFQSENFQEKLRQQKQTMFKISAAMVFFAICILIRIVGVALYAADLPDFAIYSLAIWIPDLLMTAAVLLVFWPYRLPFLALEPLKIARSFLDDSREAKSLSIKFNDKPLEQNNES